MAWESRNGRGRYYTRSKRVNGRVVREYVGCGPVGELAATQDELERAEMAAKREALNSAKAELERIEGLLSRSWGMAWDQARLTMVNEGHYRHHRGEWRKRRG